MLVLISSVPLHVEKIGYFPNIIVVASFFFFFRKLSLAMSSSALMLMECMEVEKIIPKAHYKENMTKTIQRKMGISKVNTSVYMV